MHLFNKNLYIFLSILTFGVATLSTAADRKDDPNYETCRSKIDVKDSEGHKSTYMIISTPKSDSAKSGSTKSDSSKK